MKLQVSKLQNDGQGRWTPLARRSVDTMTDAVKTFRAFASEHEELIEGKLIDITQHPEFPDFAQMKRNTIGAGDSQTLMVVIKRIQE
jgi:hypothetical protein